MKHQSALWLIAIICVAGSTRLSPAQVAIKGDTVYTMAGDPIAGGVVVVRDGKIAAVGSAADVAIPDGFEVLTAAVVTPGLIDAHTVVGLAGQYNYDHDQDQLEHAEPMQPQLRAIDAYNAHERLVAWVRSFGVTTIHTGHGPGELISGQTMIVKTTGNTLEEALVKTVATVAATLGESAQKKNDKSPGNRSKMMAMFRAELLQAQAYARKRRQAEEDEAPDRDLKLETLVKLLDRELPLMVTAHRAQDIANALRLAAEFNLRLILDGAAEAYLLIDQIKAANVDVIVHPTMMRASPNQETENMSFETAATLVNANIRVALQSGYESYVPKTRVVLFEAGWAASNGLSFEQALATITINAAQILGIADRVGSLAVGKDGDVALYDGDPFEYTTHCVAVVIDGKVVSRTPR